MEFAEKWSSDKKFGFVSSFVKAAQEGTFQSLELPVPTALAFRQTITFRGRTWFKYHHDMAADLVERFSGTYMYTQTYIHTTNRSISYANEYTDTHTRRYI